MVWQLADMYRVQCTYNAVLNDTMQFTKQESVIRGEVQRTEFETNL